MVLFWKENTAPHAGPNRDALGLVMEADEKRTMDKHLYYGFYGKERVRQGKQAYD